MAEKEYIEREAAINAVYEAYADGESAYDALIALPAADVRPVCHGRWVKARGSWCTLGGDPVWECSREKAEENAISVWNRRANDV